MDLHEDSRHLDENEDNTFFRRRDHFIHARAYALERAWIASGRPVPSEQSVAILLHPKVLLFQLNDRAPGSRNVPKHPIDQ